ncbi:MAG TPA: class I SAM-dependent methyltransferase [Stellaceae bacterium]|nr:class I SAM-dependent methyltransferase [Stellaceae bacterium]
MSQPCISGELELFAEAVHWKSYVGSVLRPFIAGRVLDVGAGIGSNIRFLASPRVAEWTCLEPDPALARRIEPQIAAGALPPRQCRVLVGTTANLDEGTQFDTILYIDVLEHIADDAAELARARRHLADRGHLVVLAPAHEFLFSPFDAAVGHYRRYGRVRLARLGPPRAPLVMCAMLDCAGFFASLANRALLAQPMPTRRQIAVWDAFLVPLSRRLDPLLGRRFGKTIVAVWRADG